MKKITIEEAVKQVLKRSSGGLTPREITMKIMEQKLYTFNTNAAETVVEHAIRKSCVGISLQVSKDEKDKAFQLADEGKYKLKEVKAD